MFISLGVLFKELISMIASNIEKKNNEKLKQLIQDLINDIKHNKEDKIHMSEPDFSYNVDKIKEKLKK